jgi:PAS domain-containing protein
LPASPIACPPTEDVFPYVHVCDMVLTWQHFPTCWILATRTLFKLSETHDPGKRPERSSVWPHLNTLHVFDDGKTIVGKHVSACGPFLFVGQRKDRPMAATPTYEELQQRVRELEKKCAERKLSQERSERLDSLKEALRDSEARYRTLTDATQAAVVVHDSDTRIVEANKTAERLLWILRGTSFARTAASCPPKSIQSIRSSPEGRHCGVLSGAFVGPVVMTPCGRW